MSPGKREDLLEEADAVCDLIAGVLSVQERVRRRLRTALVHLRHLRAAIAATDEEDDAVVERGDAVDERFI